MSIVRVGLAETKNYADGWNSIFGKEKESKPARLAASAKKKSKKGKKKK